MWMRRALESRCLGPNPGPSTDWLWDCLEPQFPHLKPRGGSERPADAYAGYCFKAFPVFQLTGASTQT
jgi:hypothetical protein